MMADLRNNRQDNAPALESRCLGQRFRRATCRRPIVGGAQFQ